jgi:toxin ParE1/3/4
MSATPYELTAAARLDLLHIWNYFAETASLDIADSLLSDLESAMMKLCEHPGIGHRRQDITQRNVLFFLVHRHFVIYRPDISPLCVIRVLHASQDLKKMLKT